VWYSSKSSKNANIETAFQGHSKIISSDETVTYWAIPEQSDKSATPTAQSIKEGQRAEMVLMVSPYS